MIKRKKLIIGLVIAAVGALGATYVTKNYVNKNTAEVKVVAYKEAEVSGDVNTSGFKINKVDNINAVEWLSDNEVITITEKNSEHENVNGYMTVNYCSIYNLSTKESKDFKDTTIAANGYFGLSTNKKYLLYGEDRYIPHHFESQDGEELTEEQKKSNEEWEALRASGDLQHQKIKILNIETGEITDLKTQKINSDADYRWISDDKILAIYNNTNNGWEILNLKGEVCAEGTFDYSNSPYSGSWITGTEDVKDLGETVEGDFYFTKEYTKTDGCLGEKIYSMDVNTKEEKLVEGVETGLESDKKNDLIVTDFYKDNDEKNEKETNGVHPHRTFGMNISNKDGSLVQSLELPEGFDFGKYSLSNDGSKFGYVHNLNATDVSYASKNEKNEKTVISVMDTKTGKIKNITTLSDFEENNSGEYESINVSNISWNEDGTLLMFTCEYNVRKTYTITLDEEAKKAFHTEEDTREITEIEHVKSNTYIVSFEK